MTREWLKRMADAEDKYIVGVGGGFAPRGVKHVPRWSGQKTTAGDWCFVCICCHFSITGVKDRPTNEQLNYFHEHRDEIFQPAKEIT